MNGKKGGAIQAEVNEDEFDSLLNSKSRTSKKPSVSAVPVEIGWKITNNQEEEEKKAIDEEDMSIEDSMEIEDALNFTDTEFDANNRDDYDVETEILKAKNATLAAIEEVDEESEQTIQRKKWEYEMKSIEMRIKEMEAEKKSKWRHLLQFGGEEVAKAWYEYVWKKCDDSNDEMGK